MFNTQKRRELLENTHLLMESLNHIGDINIGDLKEKASVRSQKAM